MTACAVRGTVSTVVIPGCVMYSGHLLVGLTSKIVACVGSYVKWIGSRRTKLKCAVPFFNFLARKKCSSILLSFTVSKIGFVNVPSLRTVIDVSCKSQTMRRSSFCTFETINFPELSQK